MLFLRSPVIPGKTKISIRSIGVLIKVCQGKCMYPLYAYLGLYNIINSTLNISGIKLQLDIFYNHLTIFILISIWDSHNPCYILIIETFTPYLMLKLKPIPCLFNISKRGHPCKLLFEFAAHYFYYYYYSRHYYLFIITIIVMILTYLYRT